MNLFHLTALLALASSSTAEGARQLGPFAGRLEDKLEAMCTDEVKAECDATLEEGDCVFGERPERPGPDASREAKEAFRAAMKERRELMLMCVCCDELDVEDLLPTAADIQARLDEKCGEFQCDSVDGDDVDCTRFDEIMGGTRRALRYKGMFKGKENSTWKGKGNGTGKGKGKGKGTGKGKGKGRDMLFCGCGCRTDGN